MNSPILVGIGAGLVSAVLFASTLTGTVLAVVLFYVTALPGFLAGLAWGTNAAAITALTGAGLTGLLLAPLAGAGYFLTIGLPITVLCHLALLARPATHGVGSGNATAAASMEWYPTGRIVTWTALMAGGVAALSIPLFGTDIETYRASLQDVLDKTFFKQFSGGLPEGMSKDDMRPVTELLIRALPAASAIVWFSIMLLNMWTAGRIAEVSGRAIRPWPEFSDMSYPSVVALGFFASLLGTFAPGILSVVATGFAGAFLVAYMLLGLIIVHAIANRFPYKFILLTGVYVGLVVFGWVALLVAFIGIGDPVFRFRQRALGWSSAPPPTDD